MTRDLPDGVADAAPPGGWEPVDDEESRERDEDAADAQGLSADDSGTPGSPILDPDATLRPDDPAEGEAGRRGADPDLTTEPDRGEEP